MSDAAEASRPNVVLIITDQQRSDHVGWVDDRFVTPNLDAIAARGAVFDRAIVANPICMPNRATLATGRMPSVHGTRYNGIPLDPDARTFMHALADDGYRTGLIGKAHLQNMGDHPDIVAQVIDQTLEHDAVSRGSSDWDTWELKSRYDDPEGVHDVPPGWYGFDHVELAIEHGDVVGGHYAIWLREHGIDPLAVRGPTAALRTDPEWSEIRQPAIGVEHYHSTWVGQRAAAFVRDAASRTEPFLLQMSFPDPHHPFTPPGDFFDRYPWHGLDVPATFDDRHERSMPHLRRLAAHRGVQTFHLAAFAPSIEQFQRALAAEIATIELIDAAVGETIEALTSTGLMENTVVVFTSDHGDMFGDHGLMLKAAMHYRATREVPLVIAGPGIAPAVATGLVSTVDLAPTLCSLTGSEPFAGMQGHDLTPMLLHGAPTTRDHVLIEEDQMFDLAGTGQPLRMRTIVTDDARLTRYAGAEHGELFDLAVDPDELDNLDHPDAPKRETPLRAQMIERLADSLVDHADRDRRPTHMA